MNKALAWCGLWNFRHGNLSLAATRSSSGMVSLQEPHECPRLFEIIADYAVFLLMLVRRSRAALVMPLRPPSQWTAVGQIRVSSHHYLELNLLGMCFLGQEMV